MVKIAIAGGSGQVGQEIIDALAETNKHELVVFSRKEYMKDSISGVTWCTVDYNDVDGLIKALEGVHTLLSFTQTMGDPEDKTQKNLIDAAIKAGVKRFAPSQWGSASTVDMPWWQAKDKIHAYLEEVNGNEKVLEYTLFQPGLFMNYLAAPYKTAKYLEPLNTMIDFENRRAIIVDGHDTIMTFTSVQDLAAVVVKAVDLESEWPIIGGISGNRMSVKDIIKVGARVRGQPFTIHEVKLGDLEKGVLTASWKLGASHPSVNADEVEMMQKAVMVGMLLSSAKGAWDVSNEMNKLLPDFKFTRLEDFLNSVWGGKP